MISWIYFIFIGVLVMATYVIGAVNIGNPNLIRKKYKNAITPALLILSSAFILFSILMPFIMPEILKYVGSDIKDYNELGDAVGGLMNPFIAIASVIVTGLAFYMQYQANQQLKKQFKIQQIESQFYEMLKLHKENVNEIEIKDRDEKTISKRRKVFLLFKAEFEMAMKMFTFNNEPLNHHSFYLLYQLFFVGSKMYAKDEMLNYYPLFSGRLDKHTTLIYVGEYAEFWEKFSVTPFQGYSEYLGHYYRHLYQTVSYIVREQRNGVLTYEQSMKYLKILRAQLSNDEQVMLFYNWVAGLYNKGGFGYNWENDRNKYFTEFLMIHNLPYGYLFPHQFIEDEILQLRNVPAPLREDGRLFEWDS